MHLTSKDINSNMDATYHASEDPVGRISGLGRLSLYLKKNELLWLRGIFFALRARDPKFLHD